MTTTFRIDRFTVPPQSRTAFLAAVRETHELLRLQPGFVRDSIVESAAEGGGGTILTVVEWSEGADVAAVAAQVRAHHQSKGFDPQRQLRDWGVATEIGWYRPV